MVDKLQPVNEWEVKENINKSVNAFKLGVGLLMVGHILTGALHVL